MTYLFFEVHPMTELDDLREVFSSGYWAILPSQHGEQSDYEPSASCRENDPSIDGESSRLKGAD